MAIAGAIAVVAVIVVFVLPGDGLREQRESAEQPTTEQSHVRSAYAAKIEEYLSKFGWPNVRAVASNSAQLRSAQGVCLADLIDFNGGGAEELLVVYYDGSSANTPQTSSINDGAAYVAEVWSYVDGEAKTVYRQPTQQGCVEITKETLRELGVSDSPPSNVAA